MEVAVYTKAKAEFISSDNSLEHSMGNYVVRDVRALPFFCRKGSSVKMDKENESGRQENAAHLSHILLTL
jgi:hypothetical protein